MSDATDAKSKDKKKRPKFWPLGFRRSKPEAELRAQTIAESKTSKPNIITTQPVETGSDISEISAVEEMKEQAGVGVNPPTEKKKRPMKQPLESERDSEQQMPQAERRSEKAKGKLNANGEKRRKETEKQEALRKMRQRVDQDKHERQEQRPELEEDGSEKKGIGWVGTRARNLPWIKGNSKVLAAIRSAPRA